MSLSVLIADDHDIIRKGLRNILSDQVRYKVIGEAVDGEDVLAKIEELKPDILLLDISMPKISGLDVINRVCRILPKIKILVISVHKADAYILKAFKAGAKGYLNKETAASQLLPALREIAGGKLYLNPSTSSYLTREQLMAESEKPADRCFLTVREEEILRLVAEGKTAKEIAGNLCISKRTVENHKAALFKKLNLRKTGDLIKYAIHKGQVLP